MKNFGANLKNIRISSDMTQKQVAENLNVSLKTISHWELGITEPNLECLTKIEDMFNVSYEELLD